MKWTVTCCNKGKKNVSLLDFRIFVVAVGRIFGTDEKSQELGYMGILCLNDGVGFLAL